MVGGGAGTGAGVAAGGRSGTWNGSWSGLEVQLEVDLGAEMGAGAQTAEFSIITTGPPQIRILDPNGRFGLLFPSK